MGVIFLTHMGGLRVFACRRCNTDVTNRESLRSTRFSAASGRAFLFVKVINVTFRSPASVLVPNEKTWTPLMYACNYCKRNVIEFLINFMPSCVYSVNGRGQTALMLAVESGSLSAVKMLAKPEILECRDDKGWTALFYATHYGHKEIVLHLLKCGARADIKDYKSRSLLMIAVSNGMPDIVGMLLVFGARDESLRFREQILNRTKAAANADSLKLVILLSIVAVTNLDWLLHNLGLERYLTFFKESNVDLPAFYKLQENDLKLLGIDKIGPRKVMLLTMTIYEEFCLLRQELEVFKSTNVEKQ